MAMAIISAYTEDNTPQENTARTVELLRSVRTNLTSELVTGKFEGAAEVSVLLRGFTDIADALEVIHVLLKNFEQQCALLVISAEPEEMLYGKFVTLDDTDPTNFVYKPVNLLDTLPVDVHNYTMLTSGKYLVMKESAKCH